MSECLAVDSQKVPLLVREVFSAASLLSRKLDTAGYLYRGIFSFGETAVPIMNIFYPNAKLGDVDSDLLTLKYKLAL